MNKIRKLLLILVISLITLTGCSSMEIEVNPDISLEVSVNMNQSVDLELEMFVDRIGFDIFNRLDTAIEDISDRLSQEGFDTEVVEREDRIGIIASRRIENSNVVHAEDISEGIDISNIIEVRDYKLVSDYIVDQKFNIREIALESEIFEDRELLVNILEQSDIEFILNLPIQTAENNADIVSENGRQLIWNIDPLEENHIVFRIVVPNIENSLWFLGICIVSFIVLIPIYRKILLLIESRGKED